MIDTGKLIEQEMLTGDLRVTLDDINYKPVGMVEVVRCKYCKHNPNNSDDDFCPFVHVTGGYVKHFPSDFFCKDGERRDDAEIH